MQTSAAQEADDAIKDFSQSKFRSINDWGLVTDTAKKLKLIDLATDLSLLWVGPEDELALERCWSSFGEGFVAAVKSNPVLWNRSIFRGLDPENVRQTKGLSETFKKDVVSASAKNLDENEDRVIREFQQFGIEPPWDLVRPSQPDRNKLGGDAGAPTLGGKSTTDLLAEQAKLAKLVMRYDRMLESLRATKVGFGLLFQPEAQPAPERDLDLGGGTTMWSFINEQWARISTEVALILNAWPVLYAAHTNGSLSTIAGQEYDRTDPGQPFDPKAAGQKDAGLDAVRTQLTGVLTAIKKFRDADVDPLDLVPVQDALYLGRVVPASGQKPTKEVLHGILDDERKTRDFNAEMTRLGIDIGLAVLMTVGVVGTMGGAAIAIGVAGVGAATADQRADNLKAGYGAAVTDAGALVTRETVSAAESEAEQAKIELVQTVVMSVVDIGTAAVEGGLSAQQKKQVEQLTGRVAGGETSDTAAGRLRAKLRAAAGGAAGAGGSGRMKAWDVAEELRPVVLKDPVNVRLRGEGIPPVGARTNPKVKEFHFDAQSWTIELNPSLVRGDTISERRFDDLIESMYHEARHAYQEFHVARWRKMKVAQGTPLREEFDHKIPADVDQAAVAMKPGDPMEASAAKWWESIYGGKALKRAEIYEKLDAADAAVSAKAAEVRNLPKFPAPAPDRERLHRELAAALEEQLACKQAYRNLPEEADAFAVAAERRAWARRGLDQRARIAGAETLLSSADSQVAQAVSELEQAEARGVSGDELKEFEAKVSHATFGQQKAMDVLTKARTGE